MPRSRVHAQAAVGGSLVVDANIDAVPEIYISTDVETDGPIPGPHSMLSFASAAYTADKRLVTPQLALLVPDVALGLERGALRLYEAEPMSSWCFHD